MNSEISEVFSSFKALRELQKHSRYCFHSCEFDALTGREEGGRAGKIALSRLQAAGFVTPLARGSGLWLIVPPEFAAVGAPPVVWWIDDYMKQKEGDYQIALLSAAKAHGSSHFALMDTQLFVARPRRVLTYGEGSRLRFFVKPSVATSPSVMLVRDGRKVRVSSVSTTILDLIRHAAFIGGIERAAMILSDLKPDLKPNDVIESLDAADDVSAAQRLGYLLEFHDAMKLAGTVKTWLQSRRTQLMRLDTSSPASRIELSRRWNIDVNCSLEICA